MKSANVSDVDGDGVNDLTLAFTNGAGPVTLLRVSSFAFVACGNPEILGPHPAF